MKHDPSWVVLCSFVLRSFVLRSFVLRSFVLRSFVLRSFVLRSFVLRSFVLRSFALRSFALRSFALRSFALRSFALRSFLRCSFALRSFALRSFALRSFALRSFVLGSFLLCSAACCSDAKPPGPDAQVGWARGVDLPAPVANNAVVGIQTEGGCMIYSLLGIDQSLAPAGVQTQGQRWREGDTQWTQLPEIPGPARLASNAVGLRGEPYLVGGYSIGVGGTETSHASLQRFNLQTGQWDDMAELLVPIDDAGVAAWRDRYLVVVSGWSNTGNVDAVQIYDVEANTWQAGTDFPGTPVFGQAAAIIDDELILIDGVGSGVTGFSIVNQAWRGALDPNNPSEIVWTELDTHPGEARYRAAAGVTSAGDLWFHGGTAEPYNYDGLRYDNSQPAVPLASTLRYSDGEFSLGDIPDKPNATMDHRAMAACGQRLFSVGGLVSGPAATAQTWSIVP